MTEQEYLKAMSELGRISREIERLEDIYKGLDRWLDDMYEWFESNHTAQIEVEAK